MIEIGPARESDVVLAFLKAEIDYCSQREEIQQYLQALHQAIGLDRHQLLDVANRGNDYYRTIRAQVLEPSSQLKEGKFTQLYNPGKTRTEISRAVSSTRGW